MIQRVQTDKVVAVSTIYRLVSSLRPPLVQFSVVVSSPCYFSSYDRPRQMDEDKSQNVHQVRSRESCTRESLKRKTKINEIPDPTLTHYRQVLCSLSQKSNETTLFRIRMRHHFFRSSTFGPIVPITNDFCFPIEIMIILLAEEIFYSQGNK